jgi:hypothetical protein
MNIAHLFTSPNPASGNTSNFSIPINQTFEKGHTLLAFIACHDSGLTPITTYEWKLIYKIDSLNGSSFVYLNQPTGTTVNPIYSGTGLSNKLNVGAIMILSGCNYHFATLLDSVTGRTNFGSSRGTNGFNTTANNTMIIQFINLFSNITVSAYTSTPSLTWDERANVLKSFGGYTIRFAIATSSLVTNNKYSLFSYTLSSNAENIAVDFALTPRRSNVLMSMCSL